MSTQGTEPNGDQVLDVRGMPKIEKHPAIFTVYDALPVGAGFVLVNDHDPKHLREEFEAGQAGAFGWEYVNREIRDWRIRITKLADGAPMSRPVVDVVDGPHPFSR